MNNRDKIISLVSFEFYSVEGTIQVMQRTSKGTMKNITRIEPINKDTDHSISMGVARGIAAFLESKSYEIGSKLDMIKSA